MASKPGMPSHAPSPAPPPSDQHAEPAASDPDPQHQASDDTLLPGQTERFLKHPAIREAPREKKVAFLESKGVTPEVVEELMGTQMAGDAPPDRTEAGERAWPTVRAPDAPSPPPQPSIPPIVTYPEFLAQPAHNPPLVTIGHLVNAAYITGALAATMYSLSRCIVTPLSRSMTASRHDFATHALEMLENFNKSLKDAASADPATNAKPNISHLIDDVSEADSDPTEFFHRDAGTQTTPSLSRQPSPSPDEKDENAVTGHENRLKMLTSHIRELSAIASDKTASSSSLKTNLSDLTTYLSEMSEQNQFHFSKGRFYGESYGLRKKDGKDAQAEALKADIRAVKAVFLSTRNFPAGARNTASFGKMGA